MTRYWRTLLALLVLAALSGSVFAQSKADAAFTKLKSLEGVWEGNDMEGNRSEVAYQVVSGGHAVLETIKGKEEPGMVTLYHLDGNKLMMTHYCSAGNQPRMTASALSEKGASLNFSFLDVTNLKTPSDGHMAGLKLSFLDDDHIAATWTWEKDGKKMPYEFKLERQKKAK